MTPSYRTSNILKPARCPSPSTTPMVAASADISTITTSRYTYISPASLTHTLAPLLLSSGQLSMFLQPVNSSAHVTHCGNSQKLMPVCIILAILIITTRILHGPEIVRAHILGCMDDIPVQELPAFLSVCFVNQLIVHATVVI